MSRAYDDIVAFKELQIVRPGWVGRYTTLQAPGALPNGTRIMKIKDEPSDMTPLGTRGTVLGSLFHEEKIAYFVEWDNWLKCAVLCMAWKVGAVT